ncbi:uncharacterized protein DDB_G0271670-like isoform X2 [Strongylocentrotus purpuratus]|uniref:Uncharacterized protein n=1 Tax=Strongylocentrotus purpuratus TaxID=7668 RepID=A0A7M7N815_STRPU|nr:uncharacterized protein DDB_G0271670-like isoform X2 [Strongylocentrotus purpuratus]
MDSELKNWGISWKDCVSFGTDNASVMLGKHKGVAAYINKENPNVYISGCSCHLMHLSAKKGGKSLQFQFDDLLIDIWYYMDKSSLRHQEIIKLQAQHGIEIRKILKHVPTRWLSLGTALQRLLENWQPLTEFFKAQASTGTTKVAKVGKKRELSPSASTRNPKKLRTCDDTKVKGNTTSEMPTTSSSSSKTAQIKPASSRKGGTPCTQTKTTTTSSTSGRTAQIKPASFRKGGTPCTQTKTTTTSSTSGRTAQIKPASSTKGEATQTSTPSASSKNVHQGSNSGQTNTTSSAAHRQCDLSKYFFSQQELSKKHSQTPKLHGGKVKANKGQSSASSSSSKKAKEPLKKNKPTLVYEQLIDPNCKLEALFLKACLPIFEETNEIFTTFGES